MPVNPLPTLNKGVMSVGDLLRDPSLHVPDYQRPYKWTPTHVNQLLDDITLRHTEGPYRLGTVVFHREDGRRNIVDGQQRTLTLMLITHALANTRLRGKPDARAEAIVHTPALHDMLETLAAGLPEPHFQSTVSQTHIRENYQIIRRRVARPEFSEAIIAFLYRQCEVVWFELDDISEAFQFFDSQNARGRDIEPHDLLKAFHLREFPPEEDHLKAASVHQWEASESDALSRLFAEHLYRIRNWSRGEAARHFGKADIALFKGVSIRPGRRHPHIEALLLAHHCVDAHHPQREDGSRLAPPFPFQLTQTVINGRRFFEMVAHYQARIAQLPQALREHAREGFAPRILDVLESYPGRRRRGDRFTRALFDNLLIAYLDKFGPDAVSRAVEKAFIWAYRLRLTKGSVQLAGMDNHAREHNLFRRLHEALVPAEFLNVEFDSIQAREVSGIEPITDLFRDMDYLERHD